jgi:hypothetical protein
LSTSRCGQASTQPLPDDDEAELAKQRREAEEIKRVKKQAEADEAELVTKRKEAEEAERGKEQTAADEEGLVKKQKELEERHAKLLEEASTVFKRLDVDHDDVLSVDELGRELTEMGMLSADIPKHFSSLDTNLDGNLSEREFVAGYDLYLRSQFEVQDQWRLPPELDREVAELVAQYSHLEMGDFTDLTCGGGFKIRQTEKRATSLNQLIILAAHVVRRVQNNREKWMVKKKCSDGSWVDHCVTSAYEVWALPC